MNTLTETSNRTKFDICIFFPNFYMEMEEILLSLAISLLISELIHEAVY